MILYGLRNLAKVMWNAPSVGKLKPFQVDKIKNQLAHFSENNIKDWFESFSLLEQQAKGGGVTPETFITLTVEKVLNS